MSSERIERVDLRVIARIRGGVAVGLHYGLDDCPYGIAALRRAWLDGFCRGIVSSDPWQSSGGHLLHVKLRPLRDRATWCAEEIEVIEIGREAGLTSMNIGELLGRSAQAVRIQSSRLGLTKWKAE